MPKRYTVGDFADSLEGIGASAVVMTLWPSAMLADPSADATALFQLALAILMDKPLLVAVEAGKPIPEHLRRVADEIVVMNMSTPAMKAMTAVAMKDAMERLKVRFPK